MPMSEDREWTCGMCGDIVDPPSQTEKLYDLCLECLGKEYARHKATSRRLQQAIDRVVEGLQNA